MMKSQNKFDNDYVYHGTAHSLLPFIAKNGLDPEASQGATWFHKDINESRRYAESAAHQFQGPKRKGALLRVKLNKLPLDAVQHLPYSDITATSEAIPPEHIEHEQPDGSWKSLASPDITKADGGALSDDEDGITAYHGSPHDFKQFDISKIGTGEGAQSYGHGLYFAGNEDVAKDYRDRLGRLDETSGETMADQYVIPRHFYQDTSEEELAENMKEAAKWSEQQIFDKGKMHYVFDDGSMLIHDDGEVRAVQKHPGHMYEVHINAHPDHFLDWDEVLEDQNPHIKAALQRVADYDEAEKGYTDLHDHLAEPDAYTGAAFYQNLADRGRDKEASEILNQMGVKGIRYKDAGSRIGNQKPSYNYVVFDHNHVAVKRKYAQGGMVDEAA